MTSSDSPPRIPLLSKTRYTAGLQCVKRLYLELYARELATPPDPDRNRSSPRGLRRGFLRSSCIRVVSSLPKTTFIIARQPFERRS